MSERPLVWPFKFRINSPVYGDQILTTLSLPEYKTHEQRKAPHGGSVILHDARKVPSGLNFTADIEEV